MTVTGKGFYHPEYGYWQTTTDPDKRFVDAYPEGTISVPLRPSELHVYKDGAWKLPPKTEMRDFFAKKVRAERDSILRTEVDPVVSNPLRWEDMPRHKREAIMEYRRLLLDIPNQKGFPEDVIWPTRPDI